MKHTPEYNDVPIPKNTSERPTEDDLAQRTLGGVKGHPDLAPAPMTPQRAKKTVQKTRGRPESKE